jgi:hypothetical protein
MEGCKMTRRYAALVLVVFTAVWAVLVGYSAEVPPSGKLAKPPVGFYLRPGEFPIYLEPGKNAGDYRNLALNPYASAGEEPAYFPHATSNSEYNKREFAARCAIDGNRSNKDVHGCGSWGPQRAPDIWWKLDFGRPVEIEKLVLFLRAAWDGAPGKEHDSFWKEATVEFSDGTTEKLALRKAAEGQAFPITKRKATWLKLKDLKAEIPDKWCALCEFEAWGQDVSPEAR